MLTEARPRDPLEEEPVSTGRAGTPADSCARVFVAGWYQLPLAAVTNPHPFSGRAALEVRGPKWAEIAVWVGLPSFWRLNRRPGCLSFSSFQWLRLLFGSGEIPVSQHGECLEMENRFLVARGWRGGSGEVVSDDEGRERGISLW